MSELQEEVKAAMNAVAEEPSTPAEEVTSTPEVKETIKEPETPAISKDASLLKEQIDNLNVALRTERETSKTKIAEMAKKLEESVSVLDKFKNVFTPPKEEAPIEPTYATSEDVERAVEKKLQSIKEEQTQNQKIEAYKQEIKTLETEWDGKDGKPVYNDEEVLTWQRDNDKTYLSPRDAFVQMKHNELIDYEVKKRLSNAKPAIEVEKPSSMSGNHEPSKASSNADFDTRAAVLQALNDASKEM